MSARFSLLLLLSLTACSSDDDDVPADAPTGGGVSVSAVTCPSGTLPNVSASDGANVYSPSSVTVAVGGVVSFTMPSSHNVVATGSAVGSGLAVGFSESKCLKFAQAGTFTFKCGPHGFTGTIVVQ